MLANALQRASDALARRRRPLLILGIVVVLGVAVPAVAAADTGFDRSILPVTQSEDATVDIDVGDAEQATLTIGADGESVHVSAVIADTDGDGVVPVRLNTSGVGSAAEESLVTADDGGEVRNVTVHAVTDGWALPADSYDLKLNRDDGREMDIASLVVEPQVSIDGARDGLRLNSTSSERITGRTTLDPGESLEVRIQSAGSSPYLVTEPTTVRDDHTFAVSLDLSTAPAGSDFEVNVRHEGKRKALAEGRIVGGEESDGPNGATTERSGPIFVEHQGDELELAAAPNRTLRGTADLAAGTELEVRLRSSASSPFLKTASTTVADDGTFAVTFDMSQLEPGTEFTVNVRSTADTSHSTKVTGVVVEPDDGTAGSGSVRLDDGNQSGDSSLLGNASPAAVGAIGLAALLAILGIVYMLGFGWP